MTTQPSQTNGQNRPGAATKPAPPQADPESQPNGESRRQANLRCPFCGGNHFDFGRDGYAGTSQLMYCRKTPADGEAPEKDISLPVKGAVCLDCGFVAMMVDLVQLRAPIRRRMHAVGPADALARKAGAAAHLARSPTDEAAEALKKMTAAEKAARGKTTGAAPIAPSPAAAAPGEDDFNDLAKLLDEAERKLGRLGRDGVRS